MRFKSGIRMWICLTGCGMAGLLDAAPRCVTPSVCICSQPDGTDEVRQGTLRFDKSVEDMGTMTEDDAPVTFRFTCVNMGDSPLTIARIAPTCSCVSVSASCLNKTIQPGKTQSIDLTFRPLNHPGTIDTDVLVYLSGSARKPVARLTLTGQVLPGRDEWARFPYAMGALRLKQNEMTFGEVKSGQRFTERILCGNSGKTPLRLTALMIPAYATFRTEPAEIPPGEEADIVVTVDASAMPAAGKDEFSFPVIIEGLNARPSDRTLNVKVKRIN